MTSYLFLSPSFDEIKKIDEEEWHKEWSDVIDSFKSSVWQQGWNAEQKFANLYGDWLVYEKPESSQLLMLLGRVKDF